MKDKNYLVRWEINISAKTPLEAAKEAFRLVQAPGTTANVFSVREERKYARSVTVDLLEEFCFNA